MSRQEVLSDRAVRDFAKDILYMSEGKDPVDVLNDLELVKKIIEGELYPPKYFRLRFKDESFKIVKGKNSLEIIKRYDLASRKHIHTTIVELTGEQEAIARSNEQKG